MKKHKRNFIPLGLLLLLPTFSLAQGQEAALEMAYLFDLVLVVVDVLACISLVLLFIFRNKQVAKFSMLCAVLLILSGTAMLLGYAVQGAPSTVYLLCGFMLLNFSYILGYVYHKKAKIESALPSLENEAAAPKNNKAFRSVTATFLILILMNLHNTILYYYDPSLVHIPVYAPITYIAPLVFLSLSAGLFFKKQRIGWILGAGFLLSNALASLINIVFSFNRPLEMEWQRFLFFLMFGLVLLACNSIFLILCFSTFVRQEFKTQKVDVVAAIVIGVLLCYYNTFLIYYLNERFA